MIKNSISYPGLSGQIVTFGGPSITIQAHSGGLNISDI
jgi:hypothetical protein